MPTFFNRYFNRLKNYALYRRIRSCTMIGTYGRFEDNLLIAERHMRKTEIEGDYVECGVWRGGISFAMMHSLRPYGVTGFHLFDSFQGLPMATAMDGASALEQQKNDEIWFDGNTASYEQFLKDLKQFKPEGIEVTIHKGWFNDTLADYPSDGCISVLRLDGDWFESTMICFEVLWDKVVPGGLILIDDYYDWSGCANAVHRFLAKKFEEDTDFYCPIRSTKYGLAYLVKPS